MIETFSDTRTEIGPDGPQEYWRVEISSHYWRDLNSQTLIPTKEKILFWDTIFCALCAIIFAFWLLQTFPGESFEIVREMWNGHFIFHEAWSIRTPPPPLPPARTLPPSSKRFDRPNLN